MAYAVLEDMVKRFGEQELIDLTDRAATGSIDEVVVAQALDDASAIIDGYLGSRYKLPLPSTPSIVVPMCCDIARYYLYDDQATEQVTKRYEDTIRYFKGVASGSIKLSVDEGEGKSNNLAQIESSGQEFSREKSKGFI
ncbi:MAG: DUF1320 family protein [Kangiella sp.]|nr:DUF1320 family protein [Kangiella sp.]